jgi:3-oxoadipate enol-lactonase/4-carboxymuconolactone decarboxylase
MPLIATPVHTYYRLDGPDDKPVVVLVHSLGLDHGMWDLQAADLLPYFRVLRYDLRGHGASAAPAGEYRIEDLGRDLIALADALGIQAFALCGLSIGGMIAQWVAANAPDRLTHLILANTTARTADPPSMGARAAVVLKSGMAVVADTALGRFFSPRMLAANPPQVAWARRTLAASNPVGYAGCCAAIRDMDQTTLLPRITTPTLVIGGTRDVSMPWPDHGAVLARDIAGARAIQLPAAHVSNLEAPRAFSAALFEMLMPAPEPAALLGAGMSVRRAVLGDAHVDRAVANTTELSQEFQELLTRYVGGTIWTRPALAARTRRLLVLTTMAALGRWEEFRMHVRTAIENGFEPCDIKEVLIQAAAYAGVPVANTGFHILTEETGFRTIEGTKPGFVDTETH